MRAVSSVPATEPTEILPANVPVISNSRRMVVRLGSERITFGDLARFASPRKTAAWLAHIAKCDVRTAERWLAGTNEPPAEAFGAVMFEIMRRYQMRVSE